MLFGDPSKFAVEFQIDELYAQQSLRALGWFNIHVASTRYGIHERNATILAASFDEIETRIRDMGKHVAPGIDSYSAAGLARDFLREYYSTCGNSKTRCGLPVEEFRRFVEDNRLVWAPDGDAAFDDCCFVLQLDLADQVRVIAFRSSKSSDGPEPQDLREIWVPSDVFYNTLRACLDAFVQSTVGSNSNSNSGPEVV